MNFNAIKNNIKEHGIRGTYDIYRENKLRAKYIKEIFPKTYEQYKTLPIDNKILVLQPRRGLNQSCRYIYYKLKNDYNYKTKVHSLHRGEVSSVEYYNNALDFVKNMATAKAVLVHESNDLLGYIDIRPEKKDIKV